MAKKIAAAFAVLLAAGLIFFACAIFGNPVSEFLVTKNAEKYIGESWPDEGYVIERVGYDFKTSGYFVEVKLEGSTDNHFTLYGGLNGKITFDTFDSAVKGKWNTAGRINDEYRKTVADAFGKENFEFLCEIAFGDIAFAESDRSEEADVPEFAISLESLILDGEYDIYETGKTAGCLTVYVSDDEVSAEKLAEILLAVKKLMDGEKIGFRAINCVLEHKVQEGEAFSEERVEVMNFAFDDIYQEGLSGRVEKADSEAKAYYEKMDLLKVTVPLEDKTCCKDASSHGRLTKAFDDDIMNWLFLLV